MLTTFPGIEEAAVVGERDAAWGEVTVAYLVCSCAIDEAELERYCRSQLGLLQTPAPPAHRRRPAPQRHGQNPKASPPARRLGRVEISRRRARTTMKEATARIKINKLLESAGWRLFADGNNAANIRLEASVTLKKADLDRLGDDFEKTGTGYVDFLLLDDRDFPFIVLEAKSEDKSPLVGKEQARRYAPCPELPLRHSLQRQPALLLGSRTRQPLHHHHLSVTGISIGLPARHGPAPNA